MRAFDRNFARAARIFDQNFMRGGRKPACPRDKIPSSARALRGDEILNGGGILSGLALNGGEILRDCEISSGSGILNLTSHGRTRRKFCRRVLRELRAEASPLRLRRKFQSASGSQMDYKFKKATTLQTACKFKASMQKFHRESCAAVELLRQKSRGETVLRNCLKFQSPPYAIKRLKFQGSMSEMGAGSPSALLKFQISVAAPSQLKFRDVPNAITRLKFQNAVAAVAEFVRSKFGCLPRAAQRCKIRVQGQGG